MTSRSSTAVRYEPSASCRSDQRRLPAGSSSGRHAIESRLSWLRVCGGLCGLLLIHTACFAADGLGSSRLRFMPGELPAAASRPDAQPAPGEPERIASPVPEKPAQVATDAGPYRIVPICKLKADIAQPEVAARADLHPDKWNYAAAVFAGRPAIDARGTSSWAPLSYAPLGPAATICHPPAYFAEPGLDRYGDSWLLQPVWSGVHFYGTVIALPGLWMVRRPWNHVCRDPRTDPAGFDATAEFFRPPAAPPPMP